MVLLFIYKDNSLFLVLQSDSVANESEFEQGIEHTITMPANTRTDD